MSINKAIIVGHVGSQPETKYTQSGVAVTNLSVATNEKWKNKDGELQENTEWHKIVVFGKLAEVCCAYLEKGRQVYLEGRIQTDKWEDKDGNTRYTTKIIASTVQFLGSAQGGSGRVADNNPPASDEDVPF